MDIEINFKSAIMNVKKLLDFIKTSLLLHLIDIIIYRVINAIWCCKQMISPTSYRQHFYILNDQSLFGVARVFLCYLSNNMYNLCFLFVAEEHTKFFFFSSFKTLFWMGIELANATQEVTTKECFVSSSPAVHSRLSSVCWVECAAWF